MRLFDYYHKDDSVPAPFFDVDKLETLDDELFAEEALADVSEQMVSLFGTCELAPMFSTESDYWLNRILTVTVDAGIKNTWEEMNATDWGDPYEATIILNNLRVVWYDQTLTFPSVSGTPLMVTPDNATFKVLLNPNNLTVRITSGLVPHGAVTLLTASIYRPNTPGQDNLEFDIIEQTFQRKSTYDEAIRDYIHFQTTAVAKSNVQAWKAILKASKYLDNMTALQIVEDEYHETESHNLKDKDTKALSTGTTSSSSGESKRPAYNDSAPTVVGQSSTSGSNTVSETGTDTVEHTGTVTRTGHKQPLAKVWTDYALSTSELFELLDVMARAFGVQIATLIY